MTITAQHPHPLRFGAAYYPEYQPSLDLERDLDLMRAAHFNVIRVGESVWSTWEPRNGEFDLEWLQPVLDGAHARGIGVILGTPTYAVPPWLWRTYPEIAGDVEDRAHLRVVPGVGVEILRGRAPQRREAAMPAPLHVETVEGGIELVEGARCGHRSDQAFFTN